VEVIPKELIKLTSIAQEKLALTRRELQEIDNWTPLHLNQRVVLPHKNIKESP
jgi:hypothetical protein